MPLKLISIDLDSTLLRDDKTYDTDRFKKALDQLGELGIMVTIITGNGYKKVTEYFDQEELQSLYFCCDNGNIIVKNDEILHAFTIDQENLDGALSYLNDFPEFAPVLSINGVGYMKEAHLSVYNPIKQYHPELHVVETFDDAPLQDGVTKVAIFSNETLERAKQLMTNIEDRFDQVSSVTSGNGWLDIYHHGGGKGAAVQYLQEKYHIMPEETMAIGDSLNDAPMMDKVGFPVSMANGDDDLIALTNYQIGTNQEQAVVNLLEQIVQDSSLEFMKEYRLN